MVEEGDIIEIDIPNRKLAVAVPESELSDRRARMDDLGDQAWQPKRDRVVSNALKAYAALTTSAARGAVRDVSQLTRRTPR